MHILNFHIRETTIYLFVNHPPGKRVHFVTNIQDKEKGRIYYQKPRALLLISNIAEERDIELARYTKAGK